MQFKPRNEFLVAKAVERKQASGIVIPGQEMEQDLAEIVAVGPGGLTVDGKRMPIEVEAGTPLKVGDIVFIRGGEYETFTDNRVQHMFVPQSAVLGVKIEEPAVVVN